MRSHGELYAVHPRMTSDETGYGAANLEAWSSFMAIASSHGATFVIVGHDRYPRDRFSTAVFAADVGLTLAMQLALPSLADGYLGMASGISAAPIFSQTPYVIFKHERQHAEQMEVELEGDRFRIAGDAQVLWRRRDSLQALFDGFDLLRSHGRR